MMPEARVWEDVGVPEQRGSRPAAAADLDSLFIKTEY